MTNPKNAFSFDELKAINSTINDIYNSYDADKPISESLVSFMKTLKTQIYFDKANFLFYKYDGENNIFEANSFPNIGWDPDDIDKYVESYVYIDDILPVMSQKEKIIVVNGDVFSQEEREKTQYYKEFVKPAQITKSIDANFPLPDESEIYVILGMFRNFGMRNFTEKDLELISTYQPHISNLIKSHVKNSDLTSKGEFFNFLGNFESLGVCVVDSKFRISSVNEAFKKITSSLSEGTITDNYITSNILRACEEISQMNEKKKVGPIEIDYDDKTFFFEVASTKPRGIDDKYVALVYPYSEFFLRKMSLLKTKYHLSEREYEILLLIIKKGWSTDDIANHLFISSSTVKKHISSSYAKIGVKNQKQLLSVLNLL